MEGAVREDAIRWTTVVSPGTGLSREETRAAQRGAGAMGPKILEGIRQNISAEYAGSYMVRANVPPMFVSTYA